MNKTAAKNFALRARAELTNLVLVQAANLGITAEGIQSSKPLEDGLVVNGQVFGQEKAKDYQHLIRRVETNGYHETMKEAIYTWFNRFVALRFMEVHDYLPIHMRILSSQVEGKKEPDALTQINQLIEELKLDRELVYQLQDQHENEQLFKYLIEKQCRQLEEKIPQVFEEVERDFYLLLPNGLLRENGFINSLVQDIPEEDWQEIEIIGWLYQYYISEEKDQVFANLSKKKIGKEEIGAATQIFTPKWIVQYLVGNSLGRLWLEDYPNSNLREHLPYYIEDAEQPAEVVEQLEALKGEQINPEDIRVMDPCMGSGHMLLEAFDVMREIYLERGYRPREIPSLILEKNLYGLDIDKRAAQLAAFALVMKARSYDRRFFERNVKLNLLGFEESNGLPLFDNVELVNLKEVNQELEKLYQNFKDAKLYGSIIKLQPVEIEVIEQAIKDIRDLSIHDILAQGYLDYEVPYVQHLLHQYQLLSQKYHVTVTNPPYMGSGGMSTPLSNYVKKHYPRSKADLFAVMMEVEIALTEKNYYTAMINQQTWMFINSYEKVRKWILTNSTLINLVHTGTETFPEVTGEVVQSVSWIARNIFIKNYHGNYIRLVDYSFENKIFQFYNLDNYYQSTQKDFKKIPGMVLAYWVSEKVADTFELENIGLYSNPCQGLSTSDNNRFLRRWYEVSDKNIGFGFGSSKDADDSNFKWFPINKGGSYRKWYGNNEYLVNYKNDGYEMKKEVMRKYPYLKVPDFVVKNQQYYFKPGLTWSALSSGSISFRAYSKGFIFADTGQSLFCDVELYYYLCGLLNSKYAVEILEIISPTLHFNSGYIKKIPFKFDRDYLGRVNDLVKNAIFISQDEWSSFETAWEYKEHPFIMYQKDTPKLSLAYQNWEKVTGSRFHQLKDYEEELNKIFINIYDLQNELTPEVADKDVTVRKADLQRDVRSFLSYLVGIIFGRYSLDKPGLAFAGGEFDRNQYQKYMPDADNIIPITEENYFQDDIVTRIVELVQLIYGEETLEENLQFIAEALGMAKNESARETIRRYFIKDFFKDHKQIYQNRPIYWQMTSGKQGVFKGLFYLHRYDETTLARIRTDYVLPLTNTLTTLAKQAQNIIDGSASSREVAAARKAKEKYQKQLQELRDYDLILKHLADQHIELDLDDGVKVNYEKFQNIPVASSADSKPVKMSLLEKL